jgi:hypothetical protein
MSCNTNSTTRSSSNKRELSDKRQQPSNHKTSSLSTPQPKQQQQPQPQATLWEHFVLHKASQHKSGFFEIDIDDAKPKPDPEAMSALEHATAGLMGWLGEQKQSTRSGSAESMLSLTNETMSKSTTMATIAPAAAANAAAKVNTIPTTTDNNDDDDSEPDLDIPDDTHTRSKTPPKTASPPTSQCNT